MSVKIILLEDDDAIRCMLVVNLKRAGFEVLEAATGEDALAVAARHHDVDVAILDIMLPDMDGIEVCKRMRDSYQFLGIIMLTAKTQERDKVKALESGADDYVTKPFGISELMARVNSLLRRVKINTEDTNIKDTNIKDTDSKDANAKRICLGKFIIDDSSRKFFKDGNEIELTPTEFSIIKLFLKNPNKAIDRDEILTKVWGEYYFGELKIVDVNMRRLRKKIEDDPSDPRYIETVWGIGYRWKEVDDSEK